MKKEAILKIIRFFIGIGIICLIVWAIATNKSRSYDPRDASSIEIVKDEIDYNNKIEYEYQNSLEGKYEKGETDTTITENGDMVIFYIITDTVKYKKP